MNDLFLTVLAGLQIGAIYAMLALGLTLIFGTLGVVNFAHGALYVIAIYAAVQIAINVDFTVALIVVPLFLFVVGVVFERGVIRFFYDRPHTDQILVTFGLAIVVEEVAKWLFGANNIPFPRPDWGDGVIIFYGPGAVIPPVPVFQEAPQLWLPFIDGFVTFDYWRIILIGVTIVAVSVLFYLLQFTRFGLIVRAGMRDSDMVQFLGINIARRFAMVVGLGAAIAGVAGLFGGPILGVTPDQGMKLLVPSFLVVVIGGMGSLAGAVLAAVIIGLSLAFTADNPDIQAVIIYLIAVVVLLFRPRGLLGRKGVFE